MGIGKLIEELGGAVAAEQAAEAVDPNAGILVKGAALVAGFMGAEKLSDTLEAHAEAKRTVNAALGRRRSRSRRFGRGSRSKSRQAATLGRDGSMGASRNFGRALL